ncbi:uncharacterized protein [Manis javanica]|uniref:uncharacterized protein n=1 Tax=Manis javanica TaxID=9974 RepID=UPI003C6D8D99
MEVAAAGAGTAPGERPRERPPCRSPAPAAGSSPAQLCSVPSRTQRLHALRCRCSSSLTGSSSRAPGTRPNAPGSFQRPRAAPALCLPLPGTLGGPARSAPWSTGPRASANFSGSSWPWAAAATLVRPREAVASRLCGRLAPGAPAAQAVHTALPESSNSLASLQCPDVSLSLRAISRESYRISDLRSCQLCWSRVARAELPCSVNGPCSSPACQSVPSLPLSPRQRRRRDESLKT